MCYANRLKVYGISNEKYQNFRWAMASSRLSDICQTCRNDEVFLESKFSKIRKIPLIKWMSRRR